MSHQVARAWELLRLRRPKEVAVLALDVLAKEPRDAAGHELLAFAKSAMGDHAGAVSSAKEAVSCAPEGAYSHYVLAFALCRAGSNRKGLEAAGQSLALDPDLACSHDLEARMHLARKDPFPALRAAERAVQLAPQDPDYHATRIRALLALDREDAAIRSAAAGLRAAPNHAELNALLGHLQVTRDPAAAVQAFLTVLRADPADTGARNGLLVALRNCNRLYRLLLPVHRGIAGMFHRGQFAAAAIGFMILTAIVANTAGPSVARVLAVVVVATLLVSTDLANAVLLLHPIGRHLLGRLHKLFAIVVTGLVAATAVLALLAWLQEQPGLRDQAERWGAAALGCSLLRLLLDHVQLTWFGKIVVGLLLLSLFLHALDWAFGR